MQGVQQPDEVSDERLRDPASTVGSVWGTRMDGQAGDEALGGFELLVTAAFT